MSEATTVNITFQPDTFRPARDGSQAVFAVVPEDEADMRPGEFINIPVLGYGLVHVEGLPGEPEDLLCPCIHSGKAHVAPVYLGCKDSFLFVIDHEIEYDESDVKSKEFRRVADIPWPELFMTGSVKESLHAGGKYFWNRLLNAILRRFRKGVCNSKESTQRRLISACAESRQKAIMAVRKTAEEPVEKAPPVPDCPKCVEDKVEKQKDTECVNKPEDDKPSDKLGVITEDKKGDKQ